jgi:hypothetical protein
LQYSPSKQYHHPGLFPRNLVYAKKQIYRISNPGDLQIRPPETVLPGEMVVIDLNKGFKMVLYAAVIIRILKATIGFVPLAERDCRFPTISSDHMAPIRTRRMAGMIVKAWTKERKAGTMEK